MRSVSGVSEKSPLFRNQCEFRPGPHGRASRGRFASVCHYQFISKYLIRAGRYDDNPEQTGLRLWHQKLLPPTLRVFPLSTTGNRGPLLLSGVTGRSRDATFALSVCLLLTRFRFHGAGALENPSGRLNTCSCTTHP